MTDTTMRQAFEDFVLSKPGAGVQTIFRKEYPCSGSYCSSSVEFGWISWQAATERATAVERERAAKVCDALKAAALELQYGPSDDLGNVMLRQVAHLGFHQCAAAIRQGGTP